MPFTRAATVATAVAELLTLIAMEKDATHLVAPTIAATIAMMGSNLSHATYYRQDGSAMAIITLPGTDVTVAVESLIQIATEKVAQPRDAKT